MTKEEIFTEIKTIILENIKPNRSLNNIILKGNEKDLILFGSTKQGDFEVDVSTPNGIILAYGIPTDDQFKIIKTIISYVTGKNYIESFPASSINNNFYYRWN